MCLGVSLFREPSKTAVFLLASFKHQERELSKRRTNCHPYWTKAAYFACLELARLKLVLFDDQRAMPCVVKDALASV